MNSHEQPRPFWFIIPSLAVASNASLFQETMDIHWGRHHLTYVNNLNKQIEGKDLDNKTLEEVDHEAYASLTSHDHVVILTEPFLCCRLL